MSGVSAVAISAECSVHEQDPRIAGFIGLTRDAWPGRSSAAVLLGDCNLRCPYCYCPEMLSGRRPAVDLTRVIEHLTDNCGRVGGVVVTGGEPTMDPNLSQLLRALRSLGIPVKIDTNGTFPGVLETLVQDRLVSFVSLDVKATPQRYDSVTAGREVWKRVLRSISVLIESGIDHEFRTTCYPGAVLTAELPHIARQLEGGMRFAIQQFQPQRTLDPAASGVRPYEADKLRRAALCCAVHLPTVCRGV